MKREKLTPRQLSLESHLDLFRGRWISTLEISLAVEGYPAWQDIKYESNGALYRQIINDMDAINSLGTKGIMITDGHYAFKFAEKPKEAGKFVSKYIKSLKGNVSKIRAILDKMDKDGTYDLLKNEFADIYGRFEEIEKELEDENEMD